MLSAQSPIGFFDSGVGGTSIWKELINLLPYENTIYLADSAHAPYGHKTKAEIIALSEKNTKLLLEKGAKIIVVACNTATTNAIDFLRKKYKVPFIGIEPAIKPAALQTKTNSVGILATAGTLSSELFAKTSEKFAANIQVVEQEGEGLVDLIEANAIEGDKMQALLKQYLNPMLAKDIDYLILGCTHYPYLIPQIQKIIGDDIKIIDSGFAVSQQIKKVLKQSNLLNKSSKNPTHQIFTNTNPSALIELLQDIRHLIEIKKLFF